MHPPSHLDIDKLITDENDPKFRVLLMLVKSLSDYLAGNTEAVNDMSAKLDAHLSAFEQDHMIYGKRKNTPMDLPYFATFAHSMEIESW